MTFMDHTIEAIEAAIKDEIENNHFTHFAFGRDDTTVEAVTNTDLDDEVPDARGDATTTFNITNPAGTTHRYTRAGGAAVDFSADNGRYIRVNSSNFAAGNNFLTAKPITAVDGGGSWFDVDNAAGAVEGPLALSSAESMILADREVLAWAWNGTTKKMISSVLYDYTDLVGEDLKEYGIFDSAEFEAALGIRQTFPVYSKTNTRQLSAAWEIEIVVSQ